MSSVSAWFQSHAKGFQGQLLLDEPLARHTYYRIGGRAQALAVPVGQLDLELLSQCVRELRLPYFFLGAGSNCLAPDVGFAGLIIRTTRLNPQLALETRDTNPQIRVGASVPIASLLRRCAQEGWSGLEYLAGIPGWLGGAIFMNAGTHLGEIAKSTQRVETFDFSISNLSGAWHIYDHEELRFEYRRNLFLPKSSVIWSAQLKVGQDSPAQVKKRIDAVLERRKSTQPLDYPSCGSVFKNPKNGGLQAWQVIDQLGLRGRRMGDAQISEVHSNWIVNLGQARSADVESLIALVQSRARAELGIDLETEVVKIA